MPTRREERTRSKHTLKMEVELVWDYDNLVAVFAVSAYPEQNLHRTNMLDLLPINVVDDIIAETALEEWGM